MCRQKELFGHAPLLVYNTFFHSAQLSEHFNYLNISRSQGLWITKVIYNDNSCYKYIVFIVWIINRCGLFCKWFLQAWIISITYIVNYFTSVIILHYTLYSPTGLDLAPNIWQLLETQVLLADICGLQLCVDHYPRVCLLLHLQGPLQTLQQRKDSVTGL